MDMRQFVEMLLLTVGTSSYMLDYDLFDVLKHLKEIASPALCV